MDKDSALAQISNRPPSDGLVERVTRRFYSRLKAARQSFVKNIKGVSDEAARQSIASVIINRLMFIYFIQKKRLIGPDADYLRSKLGESRRRGRNLFYSDFLRRLFLEGFVKRETERSDETIRLIGAAPYISDDFFARGQNAKLFKKVKINDLAFDKLLDFFDCYEWSLEERPPRSASEINPDVIGYIFERSVNQKQMGAYYTREDITDYISKNTLIPAVFDRAQKSGDYFDADGPVWELLRLDPDRYLYESMKSGGKLPTETVRERAARIKLREEVRAKMSRGEVRAINDLITYNLDIRRFAVDAIRRCESVDAIKTFRRALENISVLDPTCGSGAFLFAAIKILEPLRAACLDRMEEIVSGYHILRSIITDNIFGVDIMEEAVELCKMRLLLKLASRLESGDRFEPLPEIDSNIRAGNALTGSASPADLISLKDHKSSHLLFHWPAEFHDRLKGGGFDVIIGNPPYVSAASIRDQYSVKNYLTARCPDIYAWVMERSAALLKPAGRAGLIVPLSLSFSDQFTDCRRMLFREYGTNWFSSFARIPSALFSFDVRIRNTIHIGHKSKETARQYTTRIHRWFEAARPHLFETIEYAPFDVRLWRDRLPKLNTPALALALESCIAQTRRTVAASFSQTATGHALHFKKSAYNWLTFCRSLPPCYSSSGESIPQTKFGTVYFTDDNSRDLAFLLLNGKLMFAFWSVVGDDFDLTRWMFADFPLDLESVPRRARRRLLALVGELEGKMAENISFKLNAGKQVGNYNLAKCREVTDKSDAIFARLLGIEAARETIELLYSQIVKTDFNDKD